jgi:hypothetical protein
MILVCSAKHEFNTEDMGHRVEYGDYAMRVGGRCPMVMSYDRMSGTKYCRRILKGRSK